MTIPRNTPLSLIEIWSPRYHNRTVLIAKFKLQTHNKIIFTKVPSLKGKEYYMSGADIAKYPLDTNGKVPCYAVDLNDLKPLELA